MMTTLQQRRMERAEHKARVKAAYKFVNYYGPIIARGAHVPGWDAMDWRDAIESPPTPLRAARAARRLSILIWNCHRRTMKTNPKRSPRVLIDRERHRPDRETPHPRRKGAATLQDGIRRQPKTNPELLPNQPANDLLGRSPLRSAARLLDLFQRPSPSRPSTSTARPSPACFRLDARPSARSLMPLAMTGGSHDLKTGMGDPER